MYVKQRPYAISYMMIFWVDMQNKFFFADVSLYTFPQSSALGRLLFSVQVAGKIDFVQSTYRVVVKID